MPMSPTAALGRSPEAKMSDEDKDQFEGLCKAIDNLIADRWPGTPFTIQPPDAFTNKIAGRIARAYAIAGWIVQMQPKDGAFGKAAELLAVGAALQWAIVLVPDWGRVD